MFLNLTYSTFWGTRWCCCWWWWWWCMWWMWCIWWRRCWSATLYIIASFNGRLAVDVNRFDDAGPIVTSDVECKSDDRLTGIGWWLWWGCWCWCRCCCWGGSGFGGGMDDDRLELEGDEPVPCGTGGCRWPFLWCRMPLSA